MSATVPDQPSMPFMVSQSEIQISLSWSPNANNGGTPLTNYKLYWSQNDYATPIEVVTADSSTAQVTMLEHGVVTGDAYSFKVVSVNFIGDSIASDILENVVAGSLPSQPNNFKRATSVTPVDTRISLQWEAPSSNGGSALLNYRVMWNGGATGGETAQDILVETAASVTFHT